MSWGVMIFWSGTSCGFKGMRDKEGGEIRVVALSLKGRGEERERVKVM